MCQHKKMKFDTKSTMTRFILFSEFFYKFFLFDFKKIRRSFEKTKKRYKKSSLKMGFKSHAIKLQKLFKNRKKIQNKKNRYKITTSFVIYSKDQK